MFMCPTSHFYNCQKELSPYTRRMYMKNTPAYNIHWNQIRSNTQIRTSYPFQFYRILTWKMGDSERAPLTWVKCRVVGTICRFRFLIGDNQARANTNRSILCIGPTEINRYRIGYNEFTVISILTRLRRLSKLKTACYSHDPGLKLRSKYINRLNRLSCGLKWGASKTDSSLWLENPSWFEREPYHTWGVLETRESDFRFSNFCSRVKMSQSFHLENVLSTLLQKNRIRSNWGNPETIVCCSDWRIPSDLNEYRATAEDLSKRASLILRVPSWFARVDTANVYVGKYSTHTFREFELKLLCKIRSRPSHESHIYPTVAPNMESVWFQWIFCCARQRHTSRIVLYLPPRMIASWASLLTTT